MTPLVPTRPPESPPLAHPTWVVCLCADWCGVCRDYRPLFAQVAALHPDLRFAWLDVEDQASLVGDLDIETFPTVLVAEADGVRFLGPLTPHAQTLNRLLEALDGASRSPTVLNIPALLEALRTHTEFQVTPASAAGLSPDVPALLR